MFFLRSTLRRLPFGILSHAPAYCGGALMVEKQGDQEGPPVLLCNLVGIGATVDIRESDPLVLEAHGRPLFLGLSAHEQSVHIPEPRRELVL